MAKSTRSALPAVLLAGLVLALTGGCASAPVARSVYDYFAQPSSDDPWSRKIHGWQERERFDHGDDGLGPAAVAQPGQAGSDDHPSDLRQDYEAFRAGQTREMARQLASWIQRESREHYVPDGPIDRWATLGETFQQNGDDCDGLELLPLNLLRQLGVPRDRVYRAIVYRRSDGQHHMVTLWFENRDDPWVIDPTGAMTSGMPHMSEVPGWVPLKVFSETQDFSVERRWVARAAAR
jgi:hypothetical protein